MNITNRGEKVDKKCDHVPSFRASFLSYGPQIVQKVQFLLFCANLSQKPKCVKAIYIYGSGFYYSFSENDMPYRGLSHSSYQQLKYQKKTLKILISDQVAFAAVVYFRQVFGFFRLISKSMLKQFLLIICLNNAYYDKIYPFQQEPSHIAFD